MLMMVCGLKLGVKIDYFSFKLLFSDYLITAKRRIRQRIHATVHANKPEGPKQVGP